jgi:hypothetical protein
MAQNLTDFIIAYTVIRFHVRDSAKFGTCAVVPVSVNGTLQLNLKYAHSPLNLRILSSTSVPFTFGTGSK